MRTFLLSSVLVAFLSTISVQNGITQPNPSTITKDVDMREGPGSYYDLILRLNRGHTVLKGVKESGWINVNMDRYEGWIPDHSQLFEEIVQQSESGDNFRERMRAIYSQMSDQENDSSSAYASPTQVAAVVRGFARQYSENRGASLQYDFSENFGKETNRDDYEKFKKSRVGNWDRDKAQEYHEIEEDEVPAYNPNVEPLGWAIASLLAEEGLVNSPEVQNYLQNVTNLVVESSHRYEIPAQIYLLDQQEIAGYSTPNGIIFLTKGALEMMENEAELVFFIAHEVAHIGLQHGVTEAKNREVRIRRDEAFDELEQKLDQDGRSEEYIRVSQELSAWADQVYQYLVQNRLTEYENEADYWALIYMYRLGYNPNTAINLLNRIRMQDGEMESSVGKLEWEGLSLEKREINVMETIQELKGIKRHPNLEYLGEFQSSVRNLE